VSAALSACSCAETEQSAGCRERWPARADLRHRGVRQGGRGGQGPARGRRRQGPGAGAAGAGPALRPEGYLPYPIPLPLLSARPCLPTRCVSSSCCSSAANPAHCGRAAPIARGRLAGPAVPRALPSRQAPLAAYCTLRLVAARASHSGARGPARSVGGGAQGAVPRQRGAEAAGACCERHHAQSRGQARPVSAAAWRSSIAWTSGAAAKGASAAGSAPPSGRAVCERRRCSPCQARQGMREGVRRTRSWTSGPRRLRRTRSGGKRGRPRPPPGTAGRSSRGRGCSPSPHRACVPCCWALTRDHDGGGAVEVAGGWTLTVLVAMWPDPLTRFASRPVPDITIPIIWWCLQV